MSMPHSSRDQLHPSVGADNGFAYVSCLLGFLNYLMQLTVNDDGTIRIASSDCYALPESYLVPLPIQTGCTTIFSFRWAAYSYIESLVWYDLEMRSMKLDRIKSAVCRARASY